jgi:hypothetical protein
MRAVASEFASDFKQGLREGPRMFFAPLTPRMWRYVRNEARRGGWRAGLKAAFFDGADLLIRGRLDRRGDMIR